MKHPLKLAALCCLLALPALSWSQQTIERQVQQIADLLTVDGYQPDYNITFGRLPARTEKTYAIDLQAGRTYKLYAVCDGDCGNMDLCLYDSNGNLIDCDRLADAKPIVEVTPRWSDTFRLKVSMVDCRSNDCSFGIGVFGR